MIYYEEEFKSVIQEKFMTGIMNIIDISIKENLYNIKELRSKNLIKRREAYQINRFE